MIDFYKKNRMKTTLFVLLNFLLICRTYSQTAQEYYNMGVVKTKHEDNIGAISDYSKAIELNPNFAEAYYGRAASKIELKDYRGAIVDYTETISLNPKHAKAYCGRGMAKIILDQKDSGCLDLSKAGELGYAEAYEIIKKFCQ
jgi:tetratricopeptide (TPR) repeat protein